MIDKEDNLQAFQWFYVAPDDKFSISVQNKNRLANTSHLLLVYVWLELALYHGWTIPLCNKVINIQGATSIYKGFVNKNLYSNDTVSNDDGFSELVILKICVF